MVHMIDVATREVTVKRNKKTVTDCLWGSVESSKIYYVGLWFEQLGMCVPEAGLAQSKLNSEYQRDSPGRVHI